jgi:hypothetical protein
MTDQQIHQAGASAAPASLTPRRRTLKMWRRFGRHYLEMVAAMLTGMALLGVAIAALGEPPGFSGPLAQYAWMGLAMSAPMVAWMRRMGHAWTDTAEMTAAMLVPMFALVLPSALGLTIPGLSGHGLMGLSHVAMLAGMAALMLFRWERYAGGAHCH